MENIIKGDFVLSRIVQCLQRFSRPLYLFARSIYRFFKKPYLFLRGNFNNYILRIKIWRLEGKKNNKYYIIKRDASMVGLFSYVHTALGNIACAVEKGYIPVVDMKSSPNTYLEPFQVGEINAWELYFKQPLNYSLEDVYKCGNYIISPEKVPARYPGSRGALGMKDKEECDFWSILYKKFIILNENTNKYIDGEYNKLIKSNMRVLGVLCRGTDYTQMKPYGHQIQPQVGDIIKKVQEAMREWQCDYIYLATDEKKTLNIFEKNFPDKIITNDRKYYDDFEFDKQLITLLSFDRENDKYLQGLEYLSSIVILSRCNCLVCGLCGGSYAAIYMNGGKYEHKYVFDLGLYGIDDKTTTDMI